MTTRQQVRAILFFASLMALTAFLAGIIAGHNKAHGAELPQQSQASHLAVPEPEVTLQSAVVVSQCKRIIALVFSDSLGYLHPMSLDGLTIVQVNTEILTKVDSKNVKGVVVPCGDRDGLPL